MTGRALTQRTYRISLIVFTGAGVRLEMELDWSGSARSIFELQNGTNSRL